MARKKVHSRQKKRRLKKRIARIPVQVGSASSESVIAHLRGIVEARKAAGEPLVPGSKRARDFLELEMNRFIADGYESFSIPKGNREIAKQLLPKIMAAFDALYMDRYLGVINAEHAAGVLEGAAELIARKKDALLRLRGVSLFGRTPANQRAGALSARWELERRSLIAWAARLRREKTPEIPGFITAPVLRDGARAALEWARAISGGVVDYYLGKKSKVSERVTRDVIARYLEREFPLDRVSLIEWVSEEWGAGNPALKKFLASKLQG